MFCFHFPYFYFSYKENASYAALSWKGQTERTLSLEVVTLKDKKFPFGLVSTSLTLPRPEWIKASNPSVSLSPGEKKMWPSQLFLIWCIWPWLTLISVKILMSLILFSAKSKCQILPDIQHWQISCCDH